MPTPTNGNRRRPPQRVAGRPQGIRPPAPAPEPEPEEQETEKAPKPPRNKSLWALVAVLFGGLLVGYLAYEAGRVSAFRRQYTPCANQPSPNFSVCTARGVAQQEVLYWTNLVVVVIMTAMVALVVAAYALRWYKGKPWPKWLQAADKVLGRYGYRERAKSMVMTVSSYRLQWPYKVIDKALGRFNLSKHDKIMSLVASAMPRLQWVILGVIFGIACLVVLYLVNVLVA